MNKTKFAPLFHWRLKVVKRPIGPADFSCENLPEEIIPADLRGLVTAFRRLRQDARQRAIWNEYDMLYKPKTQQKPEPVKEGPPVFAVCGYLSQRCSSMKEAREWLADRLLRCTYPRGFIVDGRVTIVEKNYHGLKSSVMR